MIPFNVKSSMSFFRSAIDVDKLVDTAADLKSPYLFINDYANTFAAIKFYNACIKKKIKPILGAELFISLNAKDAKIRADKSFDNIILIAKNNQGWKNLSRLIAISNSPDYFYFRPRIDFDLLRKYKDGLMVFTGDSFDGIISKYLNELKDDNGDVIKPRAKFRARSLLKELIDIFGKDNVIIEIHEEGFLFEQTLNSELKELATDNDLKYIVTKSARYLKKDDSYAHKILSEMGSQWTKPDTIQFTNTNFDFSPLPKDPVLDWIADQCNVSIDTSKNRLPKYPFIPANFSSKDFLRKITFDGLKNKSKEYVDRLDRELTDINEMGFNDYFLLVWDVCNWAHKNNIVMGPGRGSAAGSLTSYCLGITNVDPIKYGLIWERFLNRGRKSLPDIDLDFPRSKRGDVVEYIKNRFGSEKVAQIITFGAMKARSILKELLKYYKIPFADSNKITSCIPIKNEDHTEVSLNDAYLASSELCQYKKQYPEIFSIAEKLEGCYKSIGVHAAGILISDIPFADSDYPLYRSADGDSLVFGYDMSDVDKLNLLKLDALGLNTLDDISECCKLARIELQNISLTDIKTFDIIGEGETAGIFQLESNLGKMWAQKLKPKSIEDISALISLIRPGTLVSGETDKYYNRIMGIEAPLPPDPALRDPLKETAGIMVYQEQQIFAAKTLTKWDLSKCDLLRKAIGKKNREEMSKFKDEFRKDSIKNGFSSDTVDTVWGVLDASASYSFNKSHGISYAVLSYITSYLKTHYPLQFYCAKLRNAQYLSDTIDEITSLILDAKSFNIEVLAPSLKYGNSDFDIIDGKIVFGLSSIKNVGLKDIAILKSVSHLSGEKFIIEAAKTKINSRAMTALAHSGALDYIGVDRYQIVCIFNFLRELSEKEIFHIENNANNDIVTYLNTQKVNARRRATIESLINGLKTSFRFANGLDKMTWEKEYIGIPISLYSNGFFDRGNTKCSVIKASREDEGFQFKSAVFIENIKEITTKYGDKMAFLTCYDDTCSFDSFVLFPKDYAKYKTILQNTKIAKIYGKIDKRGSAVINSVVAQYI